MPDLIRQTDWPLHWPYLGRVVEMGPTQRERIQVDQDGFWTDVVVHEAVKAIQQKGFTTHPDVVHALMSHDVEEWPHDPKDDELRARLGHTIDPDDIAAPKVPGATHYYRFPGRPKRGAPARFLDGPRAGQPWAAPGHLGDPIIMDATALHPTYYWPVAVNTATGEWLYSVDDFTYRSSRPAPKE